MSEQENEQQAVDSRKFIWDLLKELGGPTQDKLEQWKRSFASVHVVALDTDKIFILRPIKRHELLTVEKKAKEEGLSAQDIDDCITSTCLLWPLLSPSQVRDLEFGIVKALSQKIEEISFILPDEQLARLSFKV